jgi:hypothetical protein
MLKSAITQIKPRSGDIVTTVSVFRMSAGPIAQLVELPAHNRLVPGSSPGGPTIL